MSSLAAAPTPLAVSPLRMAADALDLLDQEDPADLPAAAITRRVAVFDRGQGCAASGMEVVTLDALERLAGVGTRLLAVATDLARARRLRRRWPVTTNDNLDALRFYQRRGMRLVAVHRGASRCATSWSWRSGWSQAPRRRVDPSRSCRYGGLTTRQEV